MHEKTRLPQLLAGLASDLMTAGQFWRQLFTFQLPSQSAQSFTQTITHQDPENLLRFIEDNPLLFAEEPDEAEAVQTVATQIHRGVIPALTDLAQVFPADPESPQAKQLLNRFTYFLSQAGELGRMRGEQLRLALGLRSRKYMLRHLESMTQRYESPSNQSREIMEHHYYLCRLVQETEKALIPLLADDPCIGKSIHLNARKQAYPNWLQKILRWKENFMQFCLASSHHGTPHYTS